MTKKIVRKKTAPPRRKIRIVRKKRRKIGFFKKLGIAFVVALIVAASLGVCFGVNTIKKVNASLDKITRGECPQSRQELNISDEAASLCEYGITNIALFGRDVDEEGEGIQRSDTILILSVGGENSPAKLVSIQSDTYVKIPGHDPNKINMSYFHGGAPLAISTLNANFDMDISKYVSVDMQALVDVVDSLGGVALNITEEEISEMNAFINETNYILGGEPSAFIENAGLQLCDGRQALVYARIRELGNSDFDRTARQRLLLSAIFNKVKENLSVKLILNMLDSVSEHIETNLTNEQMVELCYKILKSGSIQTHSLCDERYISSCNLTDSGMQVLVPDTLEEMAEALHTIIYGEEIAYTPSAQLEEFSQIVKDELWDEEFEKIYTGTTF